MLLHGEQRDEAHHASARRHHCWLGPDDPGESNLPAKGDSVYVDRTSQRSLRESAADSQPGLPPDLPQGLKHDPHSLSSLDDVLREMKAMLRNAPDEVGDSFREDVKAQDRTRSSGSGLKASASSTKLGSRGARTGGGLRGHRGGAIGRGADTHTDERSPSSQRVSQRRHTAHHGRQRSHDELDFAVCEPSMGGPLHCTQPRGSNAEARGEAPTPPWTESRKPLESLEPEGAAPDMGPPTPWAKGGSVRTLQDGDQDWQKLQSNFHSATIQNNGKVHGSGGHLQRQLSRSGSSAKRASENHMSNANISGLGFIF